MPRFFIDPLSFFAGFLAASIFWWLVARARPIWNELAANLREQREAAQQRKTSAVEENYRRVTLRRAQGMHLAAPLFALDEILQEPLVIAPPQVVEPGTPLKFEDIVSQTLPYMPAWPEIAAVYRAQAISLPHALSGNSNLVIIGQPGAGKTVALAHLASLAANRSERLEALKDFVPFFFHTANLNLPVADSKNVLEPLIAAAAEHAPLLDQPRLPGFIQNAFKNGKALLLLDGYDEIPPESQREIAEYFKALLKLYPKTRIVASGAPEYLDGLIPLGFSPLALMAWSRQESVNFIRQWGEIWSQTIGLETWSQPDAQQVDPFLLNAWLDADLENLSPLELTLKVWGAYAGDILGPRVLEVIAAHIRRIAPPNTPLAALETLAMQVVVNAQPVFDSRVARGWVKSFEVAEDMVEGEAAEDSEEKTAAASTPKAGKEKKVEKVATPTSGLLGKMVSSGLLASCPNNKMRFAHPVFAGYLAGRALTNYNAEGEILNQPDWSGKYLSLRYFAAYGDASKLAQALLEFTRLPMHRPLFAAARWLRDAPRNAPWRGKLFSALAGVLQTEGIPLNLRGQAMAAFVISSDPSAMTLFRQFSTTSNFELVRLSILGSGAMRDAKAAQILEQAMNSPSQAVRHAACMALVAIGTDETLDTVAHTLLSGDEDIRRAAAEALANDPGEGYAMLQDGAKHNDILLRRAAAYGLGRVNERWATELLQKMQIEDDQWVVRTAATEVLDSKTSAGSRAPRKLKAPSESPWLIEFAAKQGMGISPGAPATDILLQALKSENPETRLAALPYLKHTPNEGVIAQIYSAMYGDDIELRDAAYNILWELGASGVKLPHPKQYGYG